MCKKFTRIFYFINGNLRISITFDKVKRNWSELMSLLPQCYCRLNIIDIILAYY